MRSFISAWLNGSAVAHPIKTIDIVARESASVKHYLRLLLGACSASNALLCVPMQVVRHSVCDGLLHVLVEQLRLVELVESYIDFVLSVLLVVLVAGVDGDARDICAAFPVNRANIALLAMDAGAALPVFVWLVD